MIFRGVLRVSNIHFKRKRVSDCFTKRLSQLNNSAEDPTKKERLLFEAADTWNAISQAKNNKEIKKIYNSAPQELLDLTGYQGFHLMTDKRKVEFIVFRLNAIIENVLTAENFDNFVANLKNNKQDFSKIDHTPKLLSDMNIAKNYLEFIQNKTDPEERDIKCCLLLDRIVCHQDPNISYLNFEPVLSHNNFKNFTPQIKFEIIVYIARSRTIEQKCLLPKISYEKMNDFFSFLFKKWSEFKLQFDILNLKFFEIKMEQILQHQQEDDQFDFDEFIRHEIFVKLSQELQEKVLICQYKVYLKENKKDKFSLKYKDLMEQLNNDFFALMKQADTANLVYQHESRENSSL
ncbi:MAG: hypothetical protein V4591_11220 [Bdellovibrionota bacterium]